MCGIYGITTKNTEFIKNYMNICSYRGPDYQNIFENEYVTLGHNLLSITDNPDNGKQPWITPQKNILVYNGEIFNYYELCNKYKAFNPKTSCDTELLSWGLDNFGLKFIDEIDSMHAFAYYHIKKNKIFLSRDHVGIKPLFYSDLGSCLVFGSEIKGMKQIVPTSNFIDHMSLSCWSYCGLNVTKNTFFRGIYKVMPGETIEYDLKTKKINSIRRDLVVGGEGKNYDEEEFIHVFDQSIKQSLIGKRKFGIFLSGGLDSTMIAHHASKFKDIGAFTNKITPCPFDPNENYNSDFEEAVKYSKYNNLTQTVIDHSPNCYAKYWHSSEEALDEPMYNPNIPMYEQINKVMSEEKIVVTLSGDMGDEILCGYPKYFKRGLIPSFTHRDVVSQWINYRLDVPPKIDGLKYSKDDVIDYLTETTFPEDLCDKNDLISSYMRLDQIGLCSEDYFRRNDRFGMKYSMEGRFPFSSKLIMNYAMNIHSKYKFGLTDKEMKLMSRKSYQNILPNYIINKSKTGWTAPINLWKEEFESMCKNINQIANKITSTFNLELPQDKSWAPFLHFYTWILRNGMRI